MSHRAEQVRQILAQRLVGSTSRIVGLAAAVSDFPAPLGARCRIHRDNDTAIDGEVIGFTDNETLVLPFGDLRGVRRGNAVEMTCSVPAVRVGESLLGRVIDARGRFLDGRLPEVLTDRVNLFGEPVSPLNRPRIQRPLSTGIRAIDGLVTCGLGQRLGIFAGSGVGKSVLLGQMARSSSADVNVVVLVGERGREVREFIERELGPEGLARSVVVVATSDEPALMRIRAAWLGTAIADFFRERSRHVLLMMDSVTRFAMAQREIGLAAGEPPATRGYPPSVFSLMPRLLERSGLTENGSITGFYTVLVEGDDTNEPVSDTVRGILDGHLVLSRKLAHENHWPAIDVLGSISRSMPDVAPVDHQSASSVLRQVLAAWRESEDLISIGAYRQGTNPLVDVALQLSEPILTFLRQQRGEKSPLDTTRGQLLQLAQAITQLLQQPAAQAAAPEQEPVAAGA
ncbi:MAG: FliI/YscN family ATPase [Planctomycetota bacterium]|jgi:FliI/YscN family ATPase